MNIRLFYLLSYLFLVNYSNAQKADTLKSQVLVINLTANGEPELSYVLPRVKKIFINEISNKSTEVYKVMATSLKHFYNDDGIGIKDNEYPLKIMQNQFLITPLSYFFTFQNLDSGYLIHKYKFLVSIPMILTARSVREMKSISLLLEIEDKEVINPNEDVLQRDNNYIRNWRKLSSYKRYLDIKTIKNIIIPGGDF